MCGLETDRLEDHTARAHDLTPTEITEALVAGKAKTDEEIAEAWERHARHHGAHIPIIGQRTPSTGLSEATVDKVDTMRPGGYL